MNCPKLLVKRTTLQAATFTLIGCLFQHLSAPWHSDAPGEPATGATLQLERLVCRIARSKCLRDSGQYEDGLDELRGVLDDPAFGACGQQASGS
jgi:hypothetical protein